MSYGGYNNRRDSRDSRDNGSRDHRSGYGPNHGSNFQSQNDRFHPYDRQQRNNRHYSDNNHSRGGYNQNQTHNHSNNRHNNRNWDPNRDNYNNSRSAPQHNRYNNNNRGGFQNNRGGFRGNKRGGGGNNGAAMPRYKEAPDAQLTASLQNVVSAVRDVKKGVQPLMCFELPNIGIYEQSRFKENAFKMTHKLGENAPPRLSFQEIQQKNAIPKAPIENEWGCTRAPSQSLRLSFQRRTTAIANSALIKTHSKQLIKYRVDITPNINDPSVRRNIFYKSTTSQGGRQNIQQLRQFFYDNMHLFCIPNVIPTEGLPSNIEYSFTYRDDNRKYTITLTRVHSLDLTAENLTKGCTNHFTAQCLGIICRERLKQAKFSKMFWRSDFWYDTMATDDWISIAQNRGNDKHIDLQYPDLKLLQGYNITPHVCSDGIYFKTNLEYKAVSAHSIADFLNHHSIDDVERYLKGSTAVVEYSKDAIKIDGFNRDMSEESTFKTRDGSDISFRKYFEGRRVTVNREKCMVAHNNRRRNQTNYYLPSYLYITASNERQRQDTRDKIRSHSTFTAADVIKHSNTVIQKLNSQQRQRQKNPFYEVVNEHTYVPCYTLNDPSIVMLDRRGQPMAPISIREFNGRAWSRVGALVPPIQPQSTSQNGSSPPYKFGIMFDRSDARLFPKLTDIFRQFMSKRGFQPWPLTEPVPLEVDMDTSRKPDLERIRSLLRKENCKVVMVVIPDDISGSKLKIDITRHALLAIEPETAVSSPTNKYSQSQQQLSFSWEQPFQTGRYEKADLNLQFITRFRCNNKPAVMNTYENCMLKAGFRMYQIEPHLPAKVLNTSSIWVIGITVLREKGRERVVNLTCSHRPLDGSISNMHSHSTLLPDFTDIIPLTHMRTLMDKLLIEGVRRVVANREPLPETIIFLRGHLDDGHFGEMNSKEVSGAMRAINSFKKNQQIQNELSKLEQARPKNWHPRVLFTVVQNRIPDRFAKAPNPNQNTNSQTQTLSAITDAIVIVDRVVSGSHFDWIVQLGAKEQERGVFINQALRYVVAYERMTLDSKGRPVEEGLSNNTQLVSDIIQFLYATHLAYAAAVPFIKGILDMPGALLWSEHYAKWQDEQVMTVDRSLDDLVIDTAIEVNAKPRICQVSTVKHNTT